ncbi:unnamed protein product, partial [Ixodes persulcatus]
EKREFLKRRFPQLQDRNFASSRDLSFIEHILRKTNGRAPAADDGGHAPLGGGPHAHLFLRGQKLPGGRGPGRLRPGAGRLDGDPGLPQAAAHGSLGRLQGLPGPLPAPLAAGRRQGGGEPDGRGHRGGRQGAAARGGRPRPRGRHLQPRPGGWRLAAANATGPFLSLVPYGSKSSFAVWQTRGSHEPVFCRPSSLLYVSGS